MFGREKKCQKEHGKTLIDIRGKEQKDKSVWKREKVLDGNKE